MIATIPENLVGDTATPPPVDDAPLGDGLAAIRAARNLQMERHGHTADSDADLAVHYLPRKASQYLGDAIDLTGYCNGAADLASARRKLAKAGGLIAAAIERIDMEERK